MPKTIKSYPCYILLLAVHIGLVWLLPYFPTQDGPSHIYNLVILRDLLNGGREWGGFFSYQLHAVPNLGFNLIAYPLLGFFPPLIVEKIFITVYIILMGISVPLFLQTFGRPALPFSYFVFPVVFNFNLLMGFYSYVIAIPIFLISLSLSWRIRNTSTTWRFVCFNLAGFVIFYFHLIPFVFYLLSLTAFTFAETIGYRRKIIALLRLLITLTPSILNLFFYLLRGKGSFPDLSYLLSLSHYTDLFTDLFLFSTLSFSPWQTLPASLLMFLIVLFCYQPMKDYYIRRRVADIPSSAKSIICLASVLTLIYLVAPFNFGDGSFFNQRFPWVILLIVLPLLRIPDTDFFKRFGSIAIAGVAGLFLIFNAGILWQQSAKVEEFLSGLQADMPKGAFVMTYKAEVERSRVDVLLHAASHYGILKGCVDVGNYEAAYRYFPVHFKSNFPAIPSEKEIAYEPSTINWSDYPAIQYLFGWNVTDTDRKELGRYFHIIREEGALSVWRRIPIKALNV